eukprot:g39957.t1
MFKRYMGIIKNRVERTQYCMKNPNRGAENTATEGHAIQVTKRSDEGRAADLIYMNFSEASTRFLVEDWLARAGTVNKFAVDTKIGGVVDSEESYLRVHWDLDQMGRWAKEWQMEFNSDKWLRGLSYRKRLNRLGLFLRQRPWGDLIEVYKIKRGMDRVNRQGLFSR